MEAIRLFFKRLYWRLMLQRDDKANLIQMLKNPDADIADLLWEAYYPKVRHIREFMVMVYNDNREFHEATRLIAGKTVLVRLKQKLGSRFLSEAEWSDVLAHLNGIRLFVPELQHHVSSIIERYSDIQKRRAIHDRCAFKRMWP